MAEEEKKESLVHSMLEDLIKSDIKTVLKCVWKDALAPNLKKTVKQVSNVALDTWFDGGPKAIGSSSKTEKKDYSNLRRSQISVPKEKIIQNYQDIRYETREKAISVLENMHFSITNVGVYRLSEFFSASEISVPDWTYGGYGWRSINVVENAEVEVDPYTGKFKIINLVPPVSLR